MSTKILVIFRFRLSLQHTHRNFFRTPFLYNLFQGARRWCPRRSSSPHLCPRARCVLFKTDERHLERNQELPGDRNPTQQWQIITGHHPFLAALRGSQCRRGGEQGAPRVARAGNPSSSLIGALPLPCCPGEKRSWIQIRSSPGSKSNRSNPSIKCEHPSLALWHI